MNKPNARTLADDHGQATVEYALVMLAAAAIAGLLIAWAVQSGAIASLMDSIMQNITDDVITDVTP